MGSTLIKQAAVDDVLLIMLLRYPPVCTVWSLIRMLCHASQASFYYMGHFSRYIPPGSKRVGLHNGVETEAPPLEADDVKNGQALLFAPCDGNAAQKWRLSDSGSLAVRGTESANGSDGYRHGGECVDIATDSWVKGKLHTWACAHSANQLWQVRQVAGGSQIYNADSNQCMTAVSTSGDAVGLDRGTTIVAAQAWPCVAGGADNQTFTLANYDAGGFPSNFPVRTTTKDELCLQPQIERLPHFDAVAFRLPDGTASLVAMNIGDRPITFSLRDKNAQMGLPNLTLPAHAIHTYRWDPDGTKVQGQEEEAAAAALDAAEGRRPLRDLLGVGAVVGAALLVALLGALAFAMRTLSEKGWRPSDALWPPRVPRARTAPVGGGARADDGGDEGSEYQPFIGTR